MSEPGRKTDDTADSSANAADVCRTAGRIRRWTGLSILGLCVSGIFFHVTVRDAVLFPWYVWYYALPRPVLVVLAGLAAGLLTRDSPRFGKAAVLLTAALFVWMLAADWGWHGQFAARQPGELRVAVWNAAGRPHGWTPDTRLPIDWLPTTAEIASWHADLIGLVECGEGPNSSSVTWKERFPGFDVDHPGTGLVLLVRGRILRRGEIACGVESRAAWYDVEIDGRELRCVLVDIASSLRIPRTEALAAVSVAVSNWSDRAILIAGDFNLPPESQCLDALRHAGYREAFESSGTGYAPTWPSPAPVLTLDQIWGNPQIRFRNGARGWTWRSDHRPVFADVSIDQPR